MGFDVQFPVSFDRNTMNFQSTEYVELQSEKQEIIFIK